MALALRVAVAALALLVLAASCGGGAPPPAADINVEMKDFSVNLSRTAFTAGMKTLVVRNTGGSAHDLVILKTDLAPDKLPMEGAKAKEEGKVASTMPLNPGATATLTVELTPGKYVFICNEPGHYALGMRIQVTVE